MSDFKDGDVVQVTENIPGKVGKGAIGKIGAQSNPLALLRFGDAEGREPVVNFSQIKKVVSSRLFPKKLKYVAPTK